jgi:hypothetical protein
MSRSLQARTGQSNETRKLSKKRKRKRKRKKKQKKENSERPQKDTFPLACLPASRPPSRNQIR